MSSQATPSPPPSTTSSPSPSPLRLFPDAAKSGSPSTTPSPPSPPPPATKNPSFPNREDCWSEEATRTLIEAWGSQYLNLNRGNLRQKHWQEVAHAVNAAHAAKLRRTDVQCKNRIDTTKKKYKIEKSKVVDSNGRYVSAWPHFHSLDALIGDSFSKPAAAAHNKILRRRASPPPEISPSSSGTDTDNRSGSPANHRRVRDPASTHLLRIPWSVPVGPRSKRSSGTTTVAERNFSVMAAAAAAMEAEDVDEDEDEGLGSRVPRRPAAGGKKRKRRAVAESTGMREGYRMLAAAIMRLGHIYEKVEVAKQRQMVECEKQRMQFAKDLEILRAQLQLDNIKRAKCNSQINYL